MTKKQASNIVINALESFLFDQLNRDDPEYADIEEAIKKLQS